MNADDEIVLTRTPVYVSDPLPQIVGEARANQDKPFPWLKDFAQAESMSCPMGTANVEAGLTQNEHGDGK